MSQTPKPSPIKTSTPVKSMPLSPQVKPKSYLLGKSDNFFLIHNEISKQRKKIIKYESKMEVCRLAHWLEFIVIYIGERKKRILRKSF